ncbi:MAG TPA: 1,4-alpha-glucan branching protein domain-containing protein [Gemmataceae bacterium]|nr:1,4-alpha-glucan branching protein domain-containing protein [Gemmataceae bacterium]
MPRGYLVIVLHAHLPYVRHPEYDRFLEERWFFEAVTETYIPLIKFFDRLRDEGRSFKLTLSVSPTLANMMEDPLLRQRCVRHLDLLIRLAESECERTRNWPDVNFLAWMYKRLFDEARHTFVERCGTRLVTAFREYADRGNLELITCVGTHPYLPLLSAEPSTVRAQVFTSVQEHRRIFGRDPVGMWVPECAFYPGLDQVLKEAGVRYFLVDTHAIEHADPRPLFGVNAPLYCPSGVAAFGRHPATSRLVWSSKIGYPADYNYREYYRDIGFDLEQDYLEPYQYARGVRTQTGIKYHRITGPGPDKHLYNPEWGRESAEKHARDFANRCRDQVARAANRMPFPPVLVSPYDAELFGHWWFEGPQWIYYLMRELSPSPQSLSLRGERGWGEGGSELELSTPGEYLARYPIQQKGMPAPSSWGKNGYNEHWINPKTDWMWRPLHEAAVRMRETAARYRDEPAGTLRDRLLRQAGRELMLAQSSDWPFIITNGTTEEYARRRFHDHLNRFHELLSDLERDQIDPEKLGALEYMDALFPELDYRLFAG